MKKTELRELADISLSTMTKLNKNELVALSVLVKICNVLKCDIGDIMEVINP
jgi:DNA-binding Xre family transcriptional regulator